MRRVFLLYLFIFVFCFLFLVSYLEILAAFSETYVRLDRQVAFTSTTGLVCAKPATAGTETDLQVIFPTGFTVSTSSSDWTVSTTNIPSGATAWPGIGTATAASGQTVTFPSSDLYVGTLYCFRWINSSALTTASSTGSKSVTLKTRDGGSSTIDSSTFALYLISNDQIAVTATVPANPTDFQAELTSSTTGSPFPQNTTIDYSLDYGSYLTYPSTITVEAEWTLGTIEGSGTPSVEILDYVVSSASNAYGPTAPVIDLTNRKITWIISSFPANTVDQTVSFQLKTNSTYTGSSQVDFSVMGRVLSPGTQTTDSIVTRGYKYVSSSGPTATPGPGPTATPTPTVSPVPLQFINVDIRSVSQNDATIFVSTSKKTTLVLRYGTSPNNLNQTLTDLTSSLNHLTTLGELEPDTTYYFRLIARDEGGISISSDIFTFKSAVISEAPKIDTGSVVFSSLGNILTKVGPQRDKPPFILLVVGSPYAFGFHIPDHKLVKRVELFVRNKNVLGISTFAQEPDVQTNSVDVIEIGEGNYSGLLKSPLTVGIYELYVRIHDENGNIAENLVGEIRVSNPLTVLAKGSNRTIESARVSLSVYDSGERIFRAIPRDAFATRNPGFTNSQGQFIFPLPPATYRAEVLAIGYEKKEVDFTLGPTEGEEYPTVYLEKKPFSLIDFGLYFASVYSDFSYQLQSSVSSLSQSFRFFDLTAFTILAIFAYLSFLALSFRIKIPLHSFSFYFLHKNRLKRLGDKVERLIATVFEDKSRKPIADADVFLLEKGGLKILAHTVTDSSGRFVFNKLPQTIYNIQVLQEGYEPSIFGEAKVLNAEETNTPLYLHKHLHSGFSIIERAKMAAKNIVGILFETLIIGSLILEFILGLSLGWIKAAPFISISVLNLILWLDHLGNITFTKSVD